MSNNIKIPRFFRKKITDEAKKIVDAARAEGGNIKAVLRARIVPYVDKLPKGLSVDSAVESIHSTVLRFCSQTDEIGQVGRASLEELLQQYIGTMTTEQALLFLATLKVSLKAADCHAISGDPMPCADELKIEIQREAKMTEDPQGRIDELVDCILDDSLKATVFSAGHAELEEMVARRDEIDESCGDQALAFLKEGVARSDLYTAAAAAVYVAILNGEIEGVPPEAAASPEIVATFVSAGLTKASIVSRLLRGEIDRELAFDLLAQVEIAIKWTLAIVLAVGIVAVPVIIAFDVIEFFAIACPLASIDSLLEFHTRRSVVHFRISDNERGGR